MDVLTGYNDNVVSAIIPVCSIVEVCRKPDNTIKITYAQGSSSVTVLCPNSKEANTTMKDILNFITTCRDGLGSRTLCVAGGEMVDGKKSSCGDTDEQWKNTKKHCGIVDRFVNIFFPAAK